MFLDDPSKPDSTDHGILRLTSKPDISFFHIMKREIFTGVAVDHIPGLFAQHAEIAKHINFRPIIEVILITKKEGILLFNSVEEKHRYTCIMIQDGIHTLFAYESFDKKDGSFSKFVPPHHTHVRDFLNNSIDY